MTNILQAFMDFLDPYSHSLKKVKEEVAARTPHHMTLETAVSELYLGEERQRMFDSIKGLQSTDPEKAEEVEKYLLLGATYNRESMLGVFGSLQLPNYAAQRAGYCMAQAESLMNL